MPTLTVTSGPAAGQVLDVTGEVVIGRGNVDLVIEDPELSRRHAAVRPVDGGGVSIEDLGSRNGTFVDGKRISGSVVLGESGIVRMGTSEIRVEVASPDATRVRMAPVPGAAGDTLQRPRPRLPEPAAAGAAARAGTTRRRSTRSAAAGRRAATPSAGAPSPPGDAPGGGRPGSPLRARLPILIAALVVIALVVALILAQTGGSTQERTLTAHLRLGTVTAGGVSALFAGIQTGPPTGTGAVTLDLVFRPPLGTSSSSPSAVSGKLVSRFDTGSITSTLRLTARPTGGGTTRFTGKGEVTEGTGDYDGATGSFTFAGRQKQGDTTLTATLRGKLDY